MNDSTVPESIGLGALVGALTAINATTDTSVVVETPDGMYGIDHIDLNHIDGVLVLVVRESD